MRAKTIYWDKVYESNGENSLSTGKVLLWALLIISVFLVVYVRHLCVREGYAISRLASDLNEMEIQYQLMQEKQSEMRDTASLYKMGENMGLVLPDMNRTFNVQ
ncbi:MAG: hypothetical protein LRY50_03930 [Geovibrio sp.]|jgi:ABC-type maltose transport system permease subunit|uniref:hypothetical protein n=1 Tax=Geovibrio ferrireducens TaxID=46201 RepID=UPI00224527EB|nr:hypothetical protein [Geovibrio ferrireducens]MCD8492177.1 hypothetical protein [Geovibrio sp.]MCD8567522.1 hypothetical protein [Geovibrio sp.]